MNLQMLWALGICIALTITAKGQKPLQDTISITPFPEARVLLVSRDIDKLVRENNFEVLKNQFIADMKESAKDSDFPAQPREAIYMVAADGRRRIKAKPEELAPFDPVKEINEFSAGLPPVHYTIYDLARMMEYHIFLKTTEQLTQLTDINFTSIQAPLEARRKSVLKSVKVEVERENNSWQVTPFISRRSMILELSTGFNVSLFNSTLSPGLSIHFDFVFLNKHRIPRYKIGTSFTMSAVGEYQDYKFKNLHLARIYDVRLMKNASFQNNRSLWYGFLIGHVRGGLSNDSLPPRSLLNRLKFGIAAESGPLGMEFAFIPATATEPSLQSLTFRFRF